METMKFAFRWQVEDQESGLEPIVTALSQLDSYLSEHPPITQETFSEMLSLAQKLESSKILDQVKVSTQFLDKSLSLLLSGGKILMFVLFFSDCREAVPGDTRITGGATRSFTEVEAPV